MEKTKIIKNRKDEQKKPITKYKNNSRNRGKNELFNNKQTA